MLISRSIGRQFTRPERSEYGWIETKPLIKGLLAVWFVLAIPWAPFVMFSGLAFDNGASLGAYVFTLSLLLYPVTVTIAFLVRQKVPTLVLLPLLNLIGFVLGGFL